MPTGPDTPVQFLKGVGASRANVLSEYGLNTAGDLLWFFPFRYEDRRHPTRISDLGHHLDEPVLIRGRVISAHARVSPVKRMKIFEAVLEDESGAVVTYRVKRVPVALVASFLAGNVSSLLGIGGGIIKVPVLNAWCGIPPKRLPNSSQRIVKFRIGSSDVKMSPMTARSSAPTSALTVANLAPPFILPA